MLTFYLLRAITFDPSALNVPNLSTAFAIAEFVINPSLLWEIDSAMINFNA